MVIDCTNSARQFGKYEGSKNSDVNTNIFKNSLTDDYDTNNFIKFIFFNEDGIKFTAMFDGYYNK